MSDMQEDLYTKNRVVLADIVAIGLVTLVAVSVVVVELLVGDWFFAAMFAISFTFFIFVIARYVRIRRALAESPSGETEVHSQAQEVRAELAAMRAEQQQSLELLRDRLNAAQREIETAVHDKERLMAELHEIVPDAPGDASATFLIEQAHEKVAKESKRQAAQTRVAAREASILRTKSEIEEMQKELAAAEALLSESDRRAAELDNQLNDKNRELWKLKAEVQGAQSHARESRLKTMMLTRSHIKKGEHTLRMLEEMLKRWIKSSGVANVNFSTHGHASDVAAQFEKIERDFVDRYFTHVTNPEYERGQHRVIRVKSGKDPDGSEFGELVIALDDDAGRTLGLRFDLRKDAPDAANVGFVLAMLLKAQCREFRDFGVIVK